MSSGIHWLERAIEETAGNRMGAGVYRAWVLRLGLRGDERVLDVGTGGGACARHLVQLVPKGSLTCLDVSGAWLDVARRRLRRHSAVEFVAADICDFHRPRSFDVATLHFVLHDIPAARRARALAAIAQALVPEGRLFVREPLDHGMSRSELVSLLAEAGFRQAGDLREERVPLMGETVSGVWAA